MSGYLLDTNCISELVRLKPEPRVMAWMQAAEETLLYLSVLTLGEIRKGLAGLPQGKRRTHLETWLEIELGARFAGRILPIDVPVADRWGLLAVTAKKGGENALDYRRAASGDSAPSQSDSRFTPRQRLCRHTSAGVEPVESIVGSHG
jgi:predicted nucleic acid-binding protein